MWLDGMPAAVDAAVGRKETDTGFYVKGWDMKEAGVGGENRNRLSDSNFEIVDSGS